MEQVLSEKTKPDFHLIQEAAVKFAPKVTFYQDQDSGSEEQYLPCSIDFILENSLLKKRSTVTHPPFTTNKGVTPCMDWFNGAYHLMFQDHGCKGIMHITSTDAVNWKQAKNFHVADTRTSSGPSVIAYKDKLHLFYRDIDGNGILHRFSNDGENWSAQQYTGMNGDGIPHALVANNRLFVTTVDGGGKTGIMVASTDKAEPNRADFKVLYTQFTTGRDMSPAIAWFKGAYHIMFRDGNGNGIMHITSTDAVKWQQAANFHVDDTKTSDGPCLIAGQQQLHLFFRDHEGNGIMHCSTTDGTNWTETEYTGINGNGSPQAAIANDTIFVTTADGGNNDGIMLYSAWAGIPKPTQKDLQKYHTNAYYLEIMPAAFKGQKKDNTVTAPMYYTIRQVEGRIVLTYIFLYAYQGPQTVRALRAGSNFTCIVSNYGIHQGDLEWIEVTLDNDNKNIYSVGFAEHGEIKSRFKPGEYEQTEDGRPVVRAAKNGHAAYNALKLNDPDWVTTWEASGVPVNIIDLISKKEGTAWTPYTSENQLVLIGLDSNRNPINEEVWAKFSGRIGNNRINNFSSATYVNGRGLDSSDWIFVKAIGESAEFFKKIPASVKEGFGPEGPAARPFIQWNL